MNISVSVCVKHMEWNKPLPELLIVNLIAQQISKINMWIAHKSIACNTSFPSLPALVFSALLFSSYLCFFPLSLVHLLLSANIFSSSLSFFHLFFLKMSHHTAQNVSKTALHSRVASHLRSFCHGFLLKFEVHTTISDLIFIIAFFPSAKNSCLMCLELWFASYSASQVCSTSNLSLIILVHSSAACVTSCDWVLWDRKCHLWGPVLTVFCYSFTGTLVPLPFLSLWRNA